MQFLGTPQEILECLKGVGFVNIQSRTELGAPGSARNDLGPNTIMGSDMPERQANVARSVNDGRLIRMLVVAQRK